MKGGVWHEKHHPNLEKKIYFHLPEVCSIYVVLLRIVKVMAIALHLWSISF